jgi:putative FmdB family regulatory protein
MPTYEYLCDECDHRFELFQSITSRPVRKCPSCGKLRVRRLISAGAGFLFRGDGFYLTDYRSEDYKRRARADSQAASGSSEAKSDKKTNDSSSSGKKSKE